MAAHLVAFHNMGASPSHDDPFTAGVKVDFDEGAEPEKGNKAGEHSPVTTHSQPPPHAGSLIEHDHAFSRPGRVQLLTSTAALWKCLLGPEP